MATIKLGTRPKNFKKVVSFPMLDGTEGSIEVLFKYRTRKEFGAFIDSLVESAKVSAPAADPEVAFSMADLMERTAGSNADYIMQVAEGWNVVETEFSTEAVQQLSDEIPAAAIAIMDAYRVAITEGRVKN